MNSKWNSSLTRKCSQEEPKTEFSIKYCDQDHVFFYSELVSFQAHLFEFHIFWVVATMVLRPYLEYG